MTTGSFAELDALPTEELRERAFAVARKHHDIKFFWTVSKHLPDSDDVGELDGAPNSIGPIIDEYVALWREFRGRGGYQEHGYRESEPLLRAAFIDYLQTHE